MVEAADAFDAPPLRGEASYNDYNLFEGMKISWALPRFGNSRSVEVNVTYDLEEALRSGARPKVSQRIFFILRVPEVAEMAAVWIKHHLVAQGVFERFDGFRLGHEIIGVVHDLHFRIGAQPRNDAC